MEFNEIVQRGNLLLSSRSIRSEPCGYTNIWEKNVQKMTEKQWLMRKKENQDCVVS